MATPAFTAAIERQARAALLADARALESGACTNECVPLTRAYPTRLFACAADANSNDEALMLVDSVRDAASGARLHACVAGVCSGAHRSLHAADRADELRRVHYPLVDSPLTGGGLFMCARHRRVHVCAFATCAHSYENARGVRVCRLSGRTLGAALRASYTAGNTLMSRELAHQRDLEETQRRADVAARRTSSAHLDSVLHAGASLELTRANEAPTAPLLDLPPGLYVDVDVPAQDLFPEAAAANTFGDGAAPVLARLYAQAYGSVHLLLFSAQRSRLEEGVRASVLNDARRRLAAYEAQQRKLGEPVWYKEQRQIEDRALNARRTFPLLLLPTNGIVRLTAYYALMAVEMHIQLVQCAQATLATSTSADTRAVCERYRDTNFSKVVPCALDLLATGLMSGTESLIERDLLLAIFPESQTIEALGVPQNVCTVVKKDMKRLFVVALQARTPARLLRATQMPTSTVLHSADSVVSLFLQARRRRLAE